MVGMKTVYGLFGVAEVEVLEGGCVIGRDHKHERRCPSPLRTCPLKWQRGGDGQQSLHDVYFLAFFGLAAGAAGAVVDGATSLGRNLKSLRVLPSRSMVARAAGRPLAMVVRSTCSSGTSMVALVWRL